MTQIDDLAALIRAYHDKTATPLPKLSRWLFNDGRRAGLIVAGEGDVLTGTFESARQWLSDNWPADLGWPEGVDRPAPSETMPAKPGNSDRHDTACQTEGAS